MFSNISTLLIFGRICRPLNNCSLRLGLSFNSKGCAFSSEGYTEEHQYDVHSYQVPLSEAEKLRILEALNTATKEELLSYKLPKNIAQKLLSFRNKKKQFNDIKELIFVDGIGFKKIELICHHILYSEEPVKKTSAKRKTMGIIKPKVPDYVNMSSVVGVAMRNSWVSWCQLQKCQASQPSADQNTDLHSVLPPGKTSLVSPTSDGKETPSNISCMSDQVWRVCQLDSKKILDFKSDFVDIFTGVQAAVDAMPSSDVYILPGHHATLSGTQSPLVFSSAHAYGLLAVLLNKKALKEAAAVQESHEDEACGDSLSVCSGDGAFNNSKSSDAPRTSRQPPNAVYFAKESRLHRSLRMQINDELIFGARVLHAMLEGNGATHVVFSGRLEVPSIVAQNFSALHTNEKSSQAAALCMALALPAVFAT